MPDETPGEDPADGQRDPSREADSDATLARAGADDGEEPSWEEAPAGRRLNLSIPILAAVIVVPAIVVGLVVWFVASATAPENKTRLSADVANVLNAFSQSSSGDTILSRYEGETPPLYPSSIPTYPGSSLVSSVMQVTGEDVSYLVIYDTKDSRDKVAAYFAKQLGGSPWQVDAVQDGRDSTLRQFSKTDDPNLRGLVLVAESKQDDRTTIVVSAQVLSGAQGLIKQPYSPGASKPLPDGFPAAVPQYPGSTVIESSYQSQPPSTMFSVSLVTKDNAAKVLDYYRTQLQAGGMTVGSADASATPQASGTPQANTTVTFSDAKQTVGGQVTAAALAEDDSYTRIDLQVTTKSQ